jgi:hypothetical protein
LLLIEIIFIDYIKSKKNVVDLLIKCLTREQVDKSSKMMGLKPTLKELSWLQPYLFDRRSQNLGSKEQSNYMSIKYEHSYLLLWWKYCL